MYANFAECRVRSSVKKHLRCFCPQAKVRRLQRRVKDLEDDKNHDEDDNSYASEDLDEGDDDDARLRRKKRLVPRDEEKDDLDDPSRHPRQSPQRSRPKGYFTPKSNGNSHLIRSPSNAKLASMSEGLAESLQRLKKVGADGRGGGAGENPRSHQEFSSFQQHQAALISNLEGKLAVMTKFVTAFKAASVLKKSKQGPADGEENPENASTSKDGSEEDETKERSSDEEGDDSNSNGSVEQDDELHDVDANQESGEGEERLGEEVEEQQRNENQAE